MNLTRLLIGSLLLAVSAVPLQASPRIKNRVLAPGEYNAHVKSLPCEACADKIRAALEGIKGIKDVSTNRDTKTVGFTVTSRVNLKDVQARLKSASQEMGMEADYELHDLEPINNTDY
jgi:copper chaperone CopZ